MTPHECPNCGFRLAGYDTPYGPSDHGLNLTPQLRATLSRLIEARGARVPLAALITALYHGDPCGGPERPELVVKVRISNLRTVLEGSGWMITTAREGGYRLVAA